ncbi:hypothetical protein KF840_12585 [bacterium]|nr:hypothetical protein [bacterium]
MANFRHRLSRAQQREYDRSNAVAAIPVRVTARLAKAVALLEWALAHADRPRTARVAQVICDELCATLRVRSLRVEVKAERPSDARGELHGLYQSAGQREVISIWMLTAKRGQVVAYKTFLRTLVHEMGHHLDYQLLGLRDSFHTDGFFKRESSLVTQLLRAVPRAVLDPSGDGAAATAADAAAPADRPSLSRRF